MFLNLFTWLSDASIFTTVFKKITTTLESKQFLHMQLRVSFQSLI
jgi:hypothetical protein